MFLMKISILGIFSSILSFCKMNSRVLGLLISLEGLMLSLLVFIYSYIMQVGCSEHYFLVLLTFAVCEAALGLSLLVSILRLRGNDYMSSFSSLKF